MSSVSQGTTSYKLCQNISNLTPPETKLTIRDYYRPEAVRNKT